MQLSIYINSYSAISAQDSFGGHWKRPEATKAAFLPTVEPAYKDFLPKKQLRRMSRMVRMGLATTLQALERAKQPSIDAIVSGTAWGCVQDTEKFLEALIVNEEQYLTPTAFVQSTHNTVAGQIALGQQNNGYNMTYVQGNVSFELALIDALTLLAQNAATTVLVNGQDELTDHLKTMLERLRCAQPTQPMGEGAACFLLSTEAADNSVGRLIGTSCTYSPKGNLTESHHWEQLLAQAQCNPATIDLVLCGQAVDLPSPFEGAEHCSYVNLCGNYPTNSAFALALALELLQGTEAAYQALGVPPLSPQRIAIYNQAGGHHGLIVVEKIGR